MASSYSNKLENNLSKSPPTASNSTTFSSPLSSSSLTTTTTTAINSKGSSNTATSSINKLSSTALLSSIPIFDKNNNDKFNSLPSSNSMTSNNSHLMQNDNFNNDKESIDTNLNNIELRLKQQNIFNTPSTVNSTDNENINSLMNNETMSTPVATVISYAVGSTTKSCLQLNQLEYLNNSIDSNHTDIIMNVDNTINNDKTTSHQQHQAKSSSRNDLVLCKPTTSLSSSSSASPQPINIDELSNFNDTNNSIYNSKIIQSLSPNINYFNTQKNKQVPTSFSFSSVPTTNNDDMSYPTLTTNISEKKTINNFKKPDIFINNIEIDDVSKTTSVNNNGIDNDMKYDQDKDIDEFIQTKDEKFETNVKKSKRSALAWVGRKVRK
jgi:hypothetical protein